MSSPDSASSHASRNSTLWQCSISFSPLKSSGLGSSTGRRDRQSTTLWLTPARHTAVNLYGASFSFIRTIRGVVKSSSVLELIIGTRGRWSITSSKSDPAGNSRAFCTAHTTARSSISVAEYLDSVSVMCREPHWRSRHWPSGCCCHRAMPNPLDWATSVSNLDGLLPSKVASILGQERASLRSSNAFWWTDSQQKVALDDSKARMGVNSSVSRGVKASNCWASPQRDRISVLLVGVGKLRNAETRLSSGVYPVFDTLKPQ